MTDSGIFTYQTRVLVTAETSRLLDDYAALYGRVERALFADLAAGGSAVKLKAAYLRQYNITARQFNAISIGIKGKIASVRERQKGLISEAIPAIAALEKSIVKLGKLQPKTDAHRNKIAFSLHHKKRRLATRRARLTAMEADCRNGVVRLCFGSKKRFHAQFNLQANGYTSHAGWRKDWQAARASEFFVIGSKDETSGCQGCVASVNPNGSLALQLRLPNALAQPAHKHLAFDDIVFAYGQRQILESLAAGRAISYRFKRDEQGWRMFVSTEVPAKKRLTHTLAGAIGIDINAGHLALAYIDRFGNPVAVQRIDCPTYGASSAQARAIIGDAIKLVVLEAVRTSRPVIIENLDFSKKKAALTRDDPRSARMLSGFAYAQIKSTLTAACLRAGIEIIEVNPAYTSVIGAINFAHRFGFSVHQGAAVAIARRGLGLSERPTRRGVSVPVRHGGHLTFALPVRNRARHVWSHWSAIRTRLKAAHVAHARSGERKNPPQPVPPEVLLASSSTWALPAKFRQANRQPHCSADVIEDVSF